MATRTPASTVVTTRQSQVPSRKIPKRALINIMHAASVGSSRLLIVPRGSQWVVRLNGSRRAAGIFSTKDEAVQSAKIQVRAGKVPYALVLDTAGTIQEKIEG